MHELPSFVTTDEEDFRVLVRMQAGWVEAERTATSAVAASASAEVDGRKPPPMSSMEATAVRPLMALVTDISGLCSAGDTPLQLPPPTALIVRAGAHRQHTASLNLKTYCPHRESRRPQAAHRVPLLTLVPETMADMCLQGSLWWLGRSSEHANDLGHAT